MWVGSQRPDFEGRGRSNAQNPVNPVHISDAGKAAQQADAVAAQEDAVNKDPKILLIRSMIEFLTGKTAVSYTHLDVYKRQMLTFR